MLAVIIIGIVAFVAIIVLIVVKIKSIRRNMIPSSKKKKPSLKKKKPSFKETKVDLSHEENKSYDPDIYQPEYNPEEVYDI